MLYSGNFGRYHDFNALLDAARNLRNTRNDIQFLLVGNGPKREQIEERIALESLLNMKIMAFVPRERYPELLKEGAPIFGFTPEGYWLDMGRPEQFFTATQDILRRVVRTAVEGIPVGRHVQIDDTVLQDKQSVVGSFCCLASDVRLENTILTDVTQPRIA
jgi:hypothetical protein